MSCFKWKTVCMITSSIKTIYQASLDVILAAIIYFLGKIPWRRKWQATPALLPGKFCELRSLVGYSSWGHKESDMSKQLHFTSLHEKIIRSVYAYVLVCVGCIQSDTIVVFSFESANQMSECFVFFVFFGLTVICFHYLFLFVQSLFPTLG